VAGAAMRGKRLISCLLSFLRLSYPITMLPILRMISVGGVFLAIAILGLALMPPGRPHMQFAMDDAAARGALIDRRSHPEWRQFLIRSALRRADEIERLRDLPEDAPTAAAAEPNSRIAGLPAARNGSLPEDVTGSVNVAPAATMPIDIGETSSFELPVVPVDEKPPVARAPSVSAVPADSAHEALAAVTTEPPLSRLPALSPPEQAKPVVVIRKRPVRKPVARSTAPASPSAPSEAAVPPPFNLLQAFFASFSANQNAASTPAVKPAAARRARAASNKTAGIR
jgi:hypothetical protein